MSDDNSDLPAADSALGQHFLVSPVKLALLIEASGIQPDDRVVELGAGAGTVARHVPPCAMLTLVELDTGLTRRLVDHFPDATVLAGDALRIVQDVSFDVLLSNLPGDVTRELLRHVQGLSFRTAVLAVDESFAGDDLTADFLVEQLTTLDEDDFRPRQPEKSWLVRLTRR